MTGIVAIIVSEAFFAVILETLGIYNIGFFLASFPLLLGQNVTSRVMIPVYREGAAPGRLARLRYGISGGVIGLLVLMALAGPWLVDLLYDPRYGSAGGIVVLLGVGLIPQVIGMTYDQAALAAGDSRRFFLYNAVRSSLQVGLLLVGVILAGLTGAIIGMSLSMVLAHAVLIWLARAHGVWDVRHDAFFAALGLGAAALALWLHWDVIARSAALQASLAPLFPPARPFLARLFIVGVGDRDDRHQSGFPLHLLGGPDYRAAQVEKEGDAEAKKDRRDGASGHHQLAAHGNGIVGQVRLFQGHQPLATRRTFNREAHLGSGAPF